MNVTVLAQVILATETFVAQVTCVRLETRMNGFDVTTQIGLVMELLGTEGALVRLVLRFVPV